MAKKKKMTSPDLKSVYPNIDMIIEECKKHPSLVHASNILKKAEDCYSGKDTQTKRDKLNILIPKYLEYLKGQNEVTCDFSSLDFNALNETDKHSVNECITKRVSLLNTYYRFFEDNKIESKGAFDSRSKIRSTILEEFMYFLFRDYVAMLVKKSGVPDGTIKNGSVDAYSNLYFTSADVNKFIKAPSIEINTKQQDYAIFREVSISIKNAADSERIANIPLLAIENKTFLDKTMLEGSIATAEKIKMGAPYSIYIVATETYAVKFDVDPVYSRIDQIFVLRKCKHEKDNRLPKDIDAGVVQQMFWFVVSKIMRPWSSVEKKLSESGVII